MIGNLKQRQKIIDSCFKQNYHYAGKPRIQRFGKKWFANGRCRLKLLYPSFEADPRAE